MLTVLLNSLGCETLVSPTAEDALARLDRFEPRLMFVDVRLPGIDGVQFVEHVRSDSRLSRTPVYLMSAFDEPAFHAGDGFVPKPFDVDVVYDIVQREVFAAGS